MMYLYKRHIVFAIKCYLILFACFAIPLFLQSQGVSPLLQEVTDNNLELKILHNEYLTALEKAPQVSQLPDPEVGVSTFLLPIETRLGPQIFRVGATQMIPWKGLLNSKKKLELSKAKVLHQRIAIHQLELNYQLQKEWLQLYEIQKSQAILRQNIPLLDALEKQALAAVESGKEMGEKVLKINLEVEELRQQIAILKVSEATPLANINQLLNRPLDMPIAITDSLHFATILYSKDTLRQFIQANHPMIRMLESKKEVAQNGLKVNELESKPDFGVGVDYIMTNRLENSFFENNGRDVFIPRVSVKLPLYKKKYQAKEREENLRIETLNVQKANATNQMMATIEKAITDYEMAKLQLNLFEKQIIIIQSAIRIMEANFSTNENNFSELLKLEKELIGYKLDKLKAIIKSHQAKILIDKFVNYTPNF